MFYHRCPKLARKRKGTHCRGKMFRQGNILCISTAPQRNWHTTSDVQDQRIVESDALCRSALRWLWRPHRGRSSRLTGTLEGPPRCGLLVAVVTPGCCCRVADLGLSGWLALACCSSALCRFFRPAAQPVCVVYLQIAGAAQSHRCC
jgi:hypothetical protein